MWARVSVYENDAEAASRFEAGLKLFREKLLPLARQNPGWVATFNLATADRDRSITISLWLSREEMIASERAAAQARTATGHVGRDSGVSVEHYEMTLAEYREEAVADGPPDCQCHTRRPAHAITTAANRPLVAADL